MAVIGAGRGRVWVGSVAVGVVATVALSACSGDGQADAQPTVTVIKTASASASPSPSVAPSSTAAPRVTVDPQKPAEPAPFTAIVTIAGVDPDGANVSVAGYVSGVAEDGGLCTFTLTLGAGGDNVAVSTTGVENVGTTSCGLVSIPVSRLSSGTWEARLAYETDLGIAASEPLEVIVP